MNNSALKNYAISKGVKMWELAKEIGVHPSTLSCRMREDITDAQLTQYERAIDSVAERKTEAMA